MCFQLCKTVLQKYKNPEFQEKNGGGGDTMIIIRDEHISRVKVIAAAVLVSVKRVCDKILLIKCRLL